MASEILIRTDADNTIGLGHLVRCYALAQMLKNEFDITFIIKRMPSKLKDELFKGLFKLKKIKTEEEFFLFLNPGQIVILDGYEFATEYQKHVKKKGCKLVCVDDLHEHEFHADLIINHTPGIKPQDYKAQPYTMFALGPEYVLLRPSFLEQAKKKRKIEKNENLLITFGGADPAGLTEKVLKFALKFKVFRKIFVVTGYEFKINKKFRLLLSSDTRIHHLPSLNEKEMFNLMVHSDVAIVPASGTLLEVLATGCKVISGFFNENQKLLYKSYKQLGAFSDAYNFDDEFLQEAINNALFKSDPERNYFDGNSGIRILKLLTTIQNEKNIELRLATIKDLDITFKWAINYKIRKFSFTKHLITAEEHANWFFGKIRNPSCIYFIGETENKPIGSIRFDLNEDEWIISYLVDPSHHGKGFGVILLKKGIEMLLKEKRFNKKVINKITGIVMKSNIASIKAFERLGFKKVEFEGNYKFVKQLY